jgi:hypothetical protein
MKLLYQQDDCTPNSLEDFHKNFEKITGYNFLDWYNNIAKKIETENHSIKYTCCQYQIEVSAFDLFWKLYEK